MRSLRTHGDDVGLRGDLGADFLAEVGVQRTAETLVGGDDKHEFLAAFTLFEQRVGLLADVLL